MPGGPFPSAWPLILADLPGRRVKWPPSRCVHDALQPYLLQSSITACEITLDLLGEPSLPHAFWQPHTSPPPPLDSNHLRAAVSSHLKGTNPK